MRRNLSMDPILSHYNTKIEERGCFRYINIGTEGIGGRAGRLWLWNIHGFLERMKSQTLNITAHQSEGIKKKNGNGIMVLFPEWHQRSLHTLSYRTDAHTKQSKQHGVPHQTVGFHAQNTQAPHIASVKACQKQQLLQLSHCQWKKKRKETSKQSLIPKVLAVFFYPAVQRCCFSTDETKFNAKKSLNKIDMIGDKAGIIRMNSCSVNWTRWMFHLLVLMNVLKAVKNWCVCFWGMIAWWPIGWASSRISVNPSQ